MHKHTIHTTHTLISVRVCMCVRACVRSCVCVRVGARAILSNDILLKDASQSVISFNIFLISTLFYTIRILFHCLTPSWQFLR